MLRGSIYSHNRHVLAPSESFERVRTAEPPVQVAAASEDARLAFSREPLGGKTPGTEDLDRRMRSSLSQKELHRTEFRR